MNYNRATSTAIRSTLCIALCLLLVTGAWAATVAEQIDAILAAPELAHGVQGVVVQSLTTGKVLYERNPNTSLMPASNTKLFTAATALDQLGPDFTYHTSLYISGKLSPSGTLNGNIIIKGGGDPVLDLDDIDKMAVQTRHIGIRRVTGNIITDDTMFDKIRLGEGWAWDYLPDYYAAEISALNLHRNVVDVYVYPTKTVGPAVEVRLVPDTNYVKLTSSASTASANTTPTLSITREMCRNFITVSGAVPQNANPTVPDAEITVRQPQLYTGNVLKNRLAAHGVKVAGVVKDGRLPANARLVSEHTSPQLSQILALFLKPSDNLLGEVLLKTVGVAMRAKGSTAAGLEVEREFLQRAGIDISGISLVDGSGLSRLNQATPRSIVSLLVYMRSHKNAEVFVSALPIAGVDGTLKRRMKGTPAEGNIHAKTGTLSHVSCLSGYATSPTGEPLVFSIMMNGHSDKDAARKLQDQICVVLAGS